METYPEWRAAHPIRVWARERNVSITALAVKLGISPQHLNEWLRQSPSHSPRFTDLCLIMGVRPDKLRAEIVAWRQRGEQLEL